MSKFSNLTDKQLEAEIARCKKIVVRSAIAGKPSAEAYQKSLLMLNEFNERAWQKANGEPSKRLGSL